MHGEMEMCTLYRSIQMNVVSNIKLRDGTGYPEGQLVVINTINEHSR